MKWIPTILTLSDYFDYDEYVKAVVLENDKPMDIYAFANRVGILMVALRRYPNIQVTDAYKAFQQELKASKGGCGGCGKK